MSIPRALLPGGLLIAVLACADPEFEVAYDLAHSLPDASEASPRFRIDFGAPEARSALVTGWSWNEVDADGTSFVWGTGARSSVAVTLNGFRPDELRCRALGSAGSGLPPRTVGVWLDGREIARIALTDGFELHHVPIDPGVWPATDATLTLRYEPAPTTTAGGRRPAVAWDWLALTSSSGDQDPGNEARVEGDRLWLSRGQRLDFPVDLEAGARLRVDRSSRADALMVTVAEPGEPPRAVPLTGGADADLRVDRLTPATLSLLADPARLASGEVLVLDGVRVVRPALAEGL